MNTTEIQTKHDARRKEIEAKIQFLLSSELSESMSAHAVASFHNKQFELERLQTIMRISNETNTPIQNVEKFDRLAHSLLDVLLDAKEIELAKTVAVALQKLLES